MDKNENALSQFICAYIESRKQPKLEAFDKDAEKQLAALTSADAIASTQQKLREQRQELEKRYEVRNWLTDAASRAGQISLVTHALKFTHSDAKGSSVFSIPAVEQNACYLSSATLRKPAIDAVGNAAALDVAKLLQTEYQGESLIACLNRGDYSALAALAENGLQLAEWIVGFKQVLGTKQLTTHKLAKQLYFPVGSGQYHLLSPLFSSSMADALHQRIINARFSEASKEIDAAFKAGKWHSGDRIKYADTAVLNIGGTKPQNISYLNSVRGGKAFLLSCATPAWRSISKPPCNHRSIFHDNSEFSWQTKNIVWQFRQFLLSVKSQQNNADIRQRRLALTDEIIDILFNYAASIQNQTDWEDWTAAEDCELKRTQQLWLNPWRCQNDAVFRLERETGDWKVELAQDFAHWLNRKLSDDELKLGATEFRQWATDPLFKQRLREFEDDIAEDLA